MNSRHLVVSIAILFASLSLVSCGLIGSDEPDGLKISYEARHLSYADKWDWQPGQDSMMVSVSVDGERIDKVIGGPTMSGSFRVRRDRGETALVTAFILSRENWNAELEVSWGDNRETDQGYSSSTAGLPPSVSVPLNE